MKLNFLIQTYFREKARAASNGIAIPPFTLFFHSEDKSPASNFAIPDMPVKEVPQQILGQMKLAFEEQGCVPRIQFLDRFAPELQAAGFYEVERWPVLACTPEQLREAPAVEGLEMVTLSVESSLDEVKEGWNANALGYDLQAELATDEQAEAFRQSLTISRAFTARLRGQAVGAGMFDVIHNGVTELVGITTLAPFRRRGIATFLTAFATQTAFAHGAKVAFLVPENEQAGRVYERVGYHLYGTILVYST